MKRKTMFTVTLRRTDTGEDHVRNILCCNEARAREVAVWRARNHLSPVEKIYVQFEVLACRPVQIALRGLIS
jgi:hypothetical protein